MEECILLFTIYKEGNYEKKIAGTAFDTNYAFFSALFVQRKPTDNHHKPLTKLYGYFF